MFIIMSMTKYSQYFRIEWYARINITSTLTKGSSSLTHSPCPEMKLNAWNHINAQRLNICQDRVVCNDKCYFSPNQSQCSKLHSDMVSRTSQENGVAGRYGVVAVQWLLISVRYRIYISRYIMRHFRDILISISLPTFLPPCPVPPRVVLSVFLRRVEMQTYVVCVPLLQYYSSSPLNLGNAEISRRFWSSCKASSWYVIHIRFQA